MLNKTIAVMIFSLIGLSTGVLSGENTSPAEPMHFELGEFKQIYSPVDGAGNPWWINDHAFMRDQAGTWHLIGITQKQDPDEFFRLAFDDAGIEGMSEQERADFYARVATLREQAEATGTPVFNNRDERQFAHASADKLLQTPWKTEPFALVADEEKWKENALWAPHIVFHDGLYFMFYTGGGDFDGGLFRMHLATSPDMRTWTRDESNPLFIDGYHARDPMVLKVGEEWVMYYTANSEPAGGNHIVAYRTSPDLVNWSDRKTAFTDPTIGTGGGPTESPFVVRRGPYYYLFLSMRHGYIPGFYADTGVFRSTDPFHWSLEDQVGEIEAHAVEVIRNSDGQWYVSHCGWYQDGVYLAPLSWHDGQDENETSMPVPGDSR
jgi:arabinan endo-1,5-alpha-L-arabinosidase